MRQAQVVALVGLGLLVAAFLPAAAICTNPRVFSTGYGYVMTPGIDPGSSSTQSSVSEHFAGAFWALGFGDPRPGFGHDNGTFLASMIPDPLWGSWLKTYQGVPAWLLGSWGEALIIDGCIDNVPVEGAARCMLIALGDQVDGLGYFAIASEADYLSNYSFEQPGPADIVLSAVPPPSVQTTTNLGTGTISVLIGAPDVTEGLYLDPLCEAQLPAVAGYRIYSSQRSVSSGPPFDRSPASGWAAVSDVVSLQDITTVLLSCDDDSDIYLALSLVFDSGFETPFLSQNSNVIPCRKCEEGTDSDGDGFCAEAAALPPADCDDTNPAVFPGAIQACDGLNNDCDDPVWPLVPQDEIDADEDGFSVCTLTVTVTTPADCDDSTASIGPQMTETCNGLDDDCDGAIDEDDSGRDTDGDGLANVCDNCVFHANPDQSDNDADGIGDACDSCNDRDGDGYGNPGHSNCRAGAERDCHDLDRFVLPGAPEVYDGRDNDCDGLVDEGLDDDLDGIPNFRDRCSNTPVNQPVNAFGCLVRARPLTTPTPG